jgi:hypothetical protein
MKYEDTEYENSTRYISHLDKYKNAAVSVVINAYTFMSKAPRPMHMEQ